jgi:hypothetical protein
MNLARDLANQLWRLRNLYQCRKQGSGEGIPFIPRPEQEEVFRHLIETPHVPAYVIKSRRLGFSTGLNTFQVDSAAFTKGWRGILIDLKQEDAAKKMTEQIRFAFDSLPREILSRLRIIKRNDSELRFALTGETDSEDSVIFAAISARGGDTSMLHVSEMGPMAAKDPPRAKELVNGAFPAASKGRIVVETTWMGGKSGELWEQVKPIMEADPNANGKIFFFPWHGDPEAIRTDGRCTEEIEAYFRELSEKLGKQFSPEQKKYYAMKRITHRHEVYREYPSTIEEALKSPVEGAIYAPYIDELRTAGRVTAFPIDHSALVHTAWDLGSQQNTVTIFFQVRGRDIYIIDALLEKQINMTDRVSMILAKGYPLGVHLLPHDSESDKTGVKTVRQEIEEAGLKNTQVVKRTMSVWSDINKTEENFPRFIFHAKNCETLLERLENYRVEIDTSEGVSKETPLHDNNSHSADALRYIVRGIEAGLVPDTMESGGRGQAVVVSGFVGNDNPLSWQEDDGAVVLM